MSPKCLCIKSLGLQDGATGKWQVEPLGGGGLLADPLVIEDVS